MQKNLDEYLSNNCTKIVKCLFKGMSISQIANCLGCSKSNVSYHIGVLYKKYKAKTRSDFILSVFGNIIEKYKDAILKMDEQRIIIMNENKNLKRITKNIILNIKNPENLEYWFSEAEKYI